MKKKNNTDLHKRAFMVYRLLFNANMNYYPKVDESPRTKKMFNSMVADGYTKNQIIAMVFCHFEWYGHDGQNEAAYKATRSNGFPILWLSSRAKDYSEYIKSTIGKENWESDSYMGKLVSKWIEFLDED
jgi:hypothetical protein